MNNHVFLAFTLTTLAGLSTVMGAILVFWIKNTCTKYLSFGLGLSAGVMIYLSFFELLKESNRLLGNTDSRLVILMFLIGLAIAGIIDIFTHRQFETCDNANCGQTSASQNKIQRTLFKTGIFTAVIIALHNFPEGIVTFMTTGINPIFGLSIAVAIAIHNIPEGFCIALPIYHATQNKKQAFLYTLLAGLAEPVSALITYLVLLPFINNSVLGIMLAIVAGIMVYVAFDELLPTAKKFGHSHISLLGLITGMIIMAFSLYLLH